MDARDVKLPAEGDYRLQTAVHLDYGLIPVTYSIGATQKLYAVVLVLLRSERYYLQFTPILETGWLVDFCMNAFKFFESVPDVIMFDISHDMERILENPEFIKFAGQHGLQIMTITTSEMVKKSMSERVMYHVKSTLLPTVQVNSIFALNEAAKTWCRSVPNILP